jgi:hypothetical protein
MIDWLRFAPLLGYTPPLHTNIATTPYKAYVFVSAAYIDG